MIEQLKMAFQFLNSLINNTKQEQLERDNESDIDVNDAEMSDGGDIDNEMKVRMTKFKSRSVLLQLIPVNGLKP